MAFLLLLLGQVVEDLLWGNVLLLANQANKVVEPWIWVLSHYMLFCVLSTREGLYFILLIFAQQTTHPFIFIPSFWMCFEFQLVECIPDMFL